jgi:hypothetical protein
MTETPPHLILVSDEIKPRRARRPRSTAAAIEDDVESISRLAQAVWVTGQLLLEDDQGFETGPPLKQLAEEIQRYAKLVEGRS